MLLENKIQSLGILEIYTFSPSLIGAMPIIPGYFNNIKDFEFRNGLEEYFDKDGNWRWGNVSD